MRVKLIVVCLVLMFVWVKQADCQELEQARLLFYKGNAYYSDGDFQDAIQQYEDVLESGVESGPIYYNLGNAYFKDGSLGKAILNYSRAKRLLPRDADLSSNLAYARSLIKGGLVVTERSWPGHVFLALADSISLNRVTLICEILYFVVSVLVIVLILSRNKRRQLSYAAIAALVLLTVGLSLFYVQYNRVVIQKEAVIISEKSDAKFEPFGEATTFFTLYEGEGVNVVASEQGWVKIKRLDGKQGWVRISDVEFI